MRLDPASIATAVWNFITLANRTVTTRVSIQRATITLPGSTTSDTVSISAVVEAATTMELLGVQRDATADAAGGAVGVMIDLDSTTAIRATRQVGTGTVIVRVQAREEN